MSDDTVSTLERLGEAVAAARDNGVLVITDDTALADTLSAHNPTIVDAPDAQARLDALPSVELAVVDAAAGFADEAAAVQLVSRLRDVCASRVLVIGAPRSGAVLGRQQLVGLGFRRWDTTGEGDSRRRWYEFSLADYKVTPDWLNARHWANPALWDRYRW
ncbi:DUF6231 family protein [Spiribacter vilamensis]|uniref:Uncharacterized protein n=1 Tax=Spiribacter vilamensis TaxID=531306 RepID=A0A4Q8CZR4_9GAMM|nr:DUF6231 family protein [Spiribacter vilamensis]RZU98484.1 hypothetical protein EV698_0731 [Spiribacter vilamensis]TVO60646.1 hypothetical protein FPL09_00275 [Spiribacter vilamensis]